jgi:hypothetical protein
MMILLNTVKLRVELKTQLDVISELQKYCDEYYSSRPISYEFVLYVRFFLKDYTHIFRKELKDLSCTLIYTQILNSSAYLMFNRKGRNLYGAHTITYDDIKWIHLCANDTEGKFTYGIKTADFFIKNSERKPFGPQTSAVLMRRAKESEECLILFLIYYCIFFSI